MSHSALKKKALFKDKARIRPSTKERKFYKG